MTGEATGGEPMARPAAETGVRNFHKLMMLTATLARMGLGLLTFIILARYLGPVGFGVIATAMVYSGFVTLVSDFGFGVSTLREASAAPDRAGRFVLEALVGKAVLAGIITIVSAGVVVVLAPREWLGVYALIHAGSVIYSFAELMMIVPRANRRFELEAGLVLSGNVMMLVIAGIPTALTGSPLVAAVAFAGSRLLYFAVVVFVLRRWLSFGPMPTMADIVARLRGSIGYAADSILTTLSAQVDVLLFGFLLTVHDIGIYQAGARLVQVIMPFAAVLAGVYLPALSHAAINEDRPGFRRTAGRLNLEFTGLAIVGGLGFAFVGPIATGLIFGERYDDLRALWTGFGAFAILRFASASFGIQLTALGRVKVRIWAQIASIAVFVAVAAVALPRYGLDVTALLLAVSAFPVLLILGAAAARERMSGPSAYWSIALPILAAAGIAFI